LATHTPVVVTNPGWTKRFVERHACGWSVPPESPDALADCLQSVLASPGVLTAAGENAHDAARQRFDRAEMMDRYAEIVERAGGRVERRDRPTAKLN
jgi:glycosyltransferase involved in cell wall biosynthesis